MPKFGVFEGIKYKKNKKFFKKCACFKKNILKFSLKFVII